MDTSEQYIKMCEKAGEIQEAKISFVNDDVFHHIDGREGVIWLPRQDQLQEMVRGKLTMWQLVQKFWNWLWTKEPVTTDLSMEQLWLAFVMKEKYSKVWDRENWIGEK